MQNRTPLTLANETFALFYRAIRPTEWNDNPFISAESRSGAIQRGELVRFAKEPAGIGPRWHQAQLSNGTLCYVRVEDFTGPVTD